MNIYVLRFYKMTKYFILLFYSKTEYYYCIKIFNRQISKQLQLNLVFYFVEVSQQQFIAQILMQAE